MATPEPSPPRVPETATHVVRLVLSLPLAVADFDDSMQVKFKDALAKVAGSSKDDVSLSVSTGGSRRHMLAETTTVAVSIKAADRGAATTMADKLTADNINAKLAESGLPAASILEPAAVFDILTSGEPTATTGGSEEVRQGPSGIGAGAVAGIVIGVLALIAGSCWLYKSVSQPVATASRGPVKGKDLESSQELGEGPREDNPGQSLCTVHCTCKYYTLHLNLCALYHQLATTL